MMIICHTCWKLTENSLSRNRGGGGGGAGVLKADHNLSFFHKFCTRIVGAVKGHPSGFIVCFAH